MRSAISSSVASCGSKNDCEPPANTAVTLFRSGFSVWVLITKFSYSLGEAISLSRTCPYCRRFRYLGAPALREKRPTCAGNEYAKLDLVLPRSWRHEPKRGAKDRKMPILLAGPG